MRMLAALFVVFSIAFPALSQNSPAKSTQSATVPITLDHNRVIIDVRLPLSDGTTKRVRAWVNNGNPDMSITAALAQTLKLAVGAPSENHDARTVQPPPVLVVGDVQITTGKVKCYAIDRKSVGPGTSAEVTIPSTVLRNYDVVIDYVNREFTIAAPGKIRFQGTASKVNVNPENGLIHVPSKIAGTDSNLALDVGSSFSFIAGDLFTKVQNAHPAWPHMTGAVGPANMWGDKDEPGLQLMRIPSLQYGAITLSEVDIAEFAQTQTDWFSKRAGKPSGLIGANALLNYRVGIDYAHSTVYFEQLTKTRPPEMDVVGLTLRPEPDGNYTVIGVAEFEGKPSVPDVAPNDVLVAVDKTFVKGGTMGQVWSLLSGSPGEERELELSRDGKKLTVKASVHRFLAAK